MLKLNARFSRKGGWPDLGSREASVNVELELECRLVGDSNALMDRIRRLFDIARRLVEYPADAVESDPDEEPSVELGAPRRRATVSQRVGP